MKALIVYDSMYGNTEKIARSIGSAIIGDVRVLRAGEVKASDLKLVNLLIVGSPTHGGRPTPTVQDFLNKVSECAIENIKGATFDTRLSTRAVVIFGYAVGRIAESMKRKGIALIASPEAFFVKGRQGPLKDGELERSAKWAGKISSAK